METVHYRWQCINAQNWQSPSVDHVVQIGQIVFANEAQAYKLLEDLNLMQQAKDENWQLVRVTMESVDQADWTHLTR